MYSYIYIYRHDGAMYGGRIYKQRNGANIDNPLYICVYRYVMIDGRK